MPISSATLRCIVPVLYISYPYFSFKIAQTVDLPLPNLPEKAICITVSGCTIANNENYSTTLLAGGLTDNLAVSSAGTVSIAMEEAVTYQIAFDANGGSGTMDNQAHTYGISAMDPGCEGADIARVQRYVTDVISTGAEQDLNFTGGGPVKDGSQYADPRDMVLKVRQGQTIKMHIKCVDQSDGLKWCFAGGWMDLNGSGDFDHPLGVTPFEEGEETDPLGERLFKVGKIRAATPEFQTTGINFEFTVPEDATPGKSRFRIVFSDAWFAGMFLPTGLHAKGFSMDFGCEIVGDNPGRSAADSRDQGVAEEPVMLEGGTVAGLQDVVSDGVSEAVYADGKLYFTNVEKAWVYSADGKFVKFASANPKSLSLEGVAPGAYIVKMQYQNVVRTTKFLVK